MGKTWEKHGKIMENHGKSWENHGKSWKINANTPQFCLRPQHPRAVRPRNAMGTEPLLCRQLALVEVTHHAGDHQQPRDDLAKTTISAP